MAVTEFALNSPLAVQRWSASLAKQATVKQYFRKFMGTGEEALIKVKRDLQKKAGESVTVGLRAKLAGDGIEGDAQIEGTEAEEALSFFNDKLYIDQRRKGTKSKGKMSEQRVPYALRKEGRDALADWFAEDFDQQIMMYLAGARGVNSDFHTPTSFTGRANNTLTAPDAGHIIYGGNATGKADLTVDDIPSIDIIEKLNAISKKDTYLRPFNINGQRKLVFLMHPYQEHALRTASSTGDWKDIRKNIDTGGKSPLISGALGEYAGIILHEHPYVIEFDDYGATNDIAAARGLLLGAHAGMIAWGGQSSEGRYSWNEETDDRGNALVITAGTIYGVKKTRFNNKDIGVYAIDTAVKSPV